ncbi:MAG: Ger(x)C family spore germination protein, partial [Oscillospiraceae bacterium]
LFAVLFCALFSLSGCTTALYHQLLITGFGVDRTEEGYEVIVRAASLSKEGEEEQYIVKGETVYEALNALSLTAGKKPLYANAGYLIFGQEIAQEGLDKILDFFMRYFKSRPTINLYMAENTAKEILETKKDDRFISSEVIRAYTENERNRGKTTSATAMSLISDVKMGGGDTVIPVIRKKGEELDCVVSAAFRGYRFNTLLNEEETRGFLAAKGILHGESFVLKGREGEKITTEIMKTRTNLTHKMENGQPRFTLAIHVDAVLVSAALSSDPAGYREIEALLSEKIQNCARESLEKSLQNKSDVLRFGRHLYLHEADFWRQSQKNWADQLPEIAAEISVTTTLTRIGEEDKPPY